MVPDCAPLERGGEVTRHCADFAGGFVEDESLMVKIVGDGMRRIVRPDSSESFGMGRDEYLACIWRISGIGDESLFLLYKCVGAECVDVHLHKRHEIERICVWLLTLGDVEKFTAVVRIVGDGCRGTAIGHRNGKVAFQIIPHKIIAVAIARNAVVGTFTRRIMPASLFPSTTS